MSKPGSQRFLSFLLVALLAGVAWADENPQVPAAQPMIGEMAPDFSLAAIAGDSLSLSDLQGKYLVIHFGASW